MTTKFVRLFFVWMVLLPAWLFAGIVEKVYTLSDPSVSRSGEFSKISLKNAVLSGEAGKPALPWCSVALLLPPGEKAVSMEVIREQKKTVSGVYKVFPFQPPRTISSGESGEILQDKAFYRSRDPYPAKIQGELITQYLNGFGFALCTFTPAEYIPADGRFSFYEQVTIRIHTAPADGSGHVTRYDAGALERVKQLAHNPELTDLYPPVTNSTDDYEILIITSDLFINSFTQLIDLYYVRGYKTKVVNVSAIYAGMTGVDNPQKIRNYIIQEYQNNSIDHVILGGDTEHVPKRGLTDSAYSGGWIIDYNIPADIYFSALDGSWNADGDSYWGEKYDWDLLPEISVGRLPASTTTELNALLNKIIKYQNKPVVADLRKNLMNGEYLYAAPYTTGGPFMELLIGYHADSGYTTYGITPSHFFTKLYETYDNQIPGTTVLANINNGYNFIHHLGHSNTSYMMRFGTSSVTDATLNQLNGTTHGYAIGYTQGCYPGQFDADLCIVEKALTINNFACGFIANSRYGWFNEGSSNGPSQHLHREFVDALYHDREPTLGMAHTISKIMTAPWVTLPEWELGAQRWVHYDCNVLGDPVMHVWTDYPMNLSVNYPDSILVSSTGFTVSADTSGTPVNGLYATLIQANVMKATAKTNSSGNASLSIPASSLSTGPAMLVVAGYNCLPDTFNIQVVTSMTTTPVQWVGTASANWSNPANWSNGTPDPNADITITPATNNPVVDVNTTVHHLTINPNCNASMNAGKFMTITGDVTIESPGGLRIKSDVNGLGSLIVEGNVNYSNGGTFSFEQYVEANKIYYICPPVSGLTRQSAFGGAIKLFQWDASAGAWQQLTIDATPLEIMRGYVVKYATSQTLTFTGPLITGTQATGTSGHVSLVNGPNYGWNLIGNPYTSAIDVGSESSPNAGWVIGGDVQPFVSYRKTDGNIAYYSKAGNGQGVNDGTQFIPPCQAYWVNVDGNTNLTYQSSRPAQTHSTQNTYKNSTAKQEIFRMKAWRKTFSDEAVIGFYADGSMQTDKYDIRKMIVNDTSFAMIYTLDGSRQLALNGLPEYTGFQDSIVSIPLGFQCFAQGIYKFEADLSGISERVIVRLEDTQTGLVQDLRQNPVYSFPSSAVVNNGRFILHFQPAQIRGQLRYAGQTAFGIKEAELVLCDSSGTLVDVCTTDENGNFAFTSFDPGKDYSMKVFTSHPAGGINALDALFVLKHFTGLQSLSGMALKAADVNMDQGVNSVDALLIQQYFVEQIMTFQAGSWQWEIPAIQAIQPGEQRLLELKGLCTGDVNGSFVISE